MSRSYLILVLAMALPGCHHSGTVHHIPGSAWNGIDLSGLGAGASTASITGPDSTDRQAQLANEWARAHPLPQ